MLPHKPGQQKAITAAQAPQSPTVGTVAKRRDPMRSLDVIMPTPPRPPANLPAVTGPAPNLAPARESQPVPYRTPLHSMTVIAVCLTFGAAAIYLTGFADTAEKLLYGCAISMAVLIGLLIADYQMTRRKP